MTLHQAMIMILKDLPSQSASCKLLSEEIKQRNLYRKQNGGYADHVQIRARAVKYPKLFHIEDGSIIKLIEPEKRKKLFGFW